MLESWLCRERVLAVACLSAGRGVFVSTSRRNLGSPSGGSSSLTASDRLADVTVGNPRNSSPEPIGPLGVGEERVVVVHPVARFLSNVVLHARAWWRQVFEKKFACEIVAVSGHECACEHM